MKPNEQNNEENPCKVPPNTVISVECEAISNENDIQVRDLEGFIIHEAETGEFTIGQKDVFTTKIDKANNKYSVKYIHGDAVENTFGCTCNGKSVPLYIHKIREYEVLMYFYDELMTCI